MSERQYKRGIMWFRRDLRVGDNTALSAACEACEEIVPLFVIDREILAREDTGPARVIFLLDAIQHLSGSLQSLGGRLVIREGKSPDEVIAAAKEWGADAVFFNRDYEPYARKRDRALEDGLAKLNIAAISHHDHVIHEPTDISSQAGTPYTVYTPYKRVWFETPVTSVVPAPGKIVVPRDILGGNLPTADELHVSTVQQFECGGEKAATKLLADFADAHVSDYREQRNFPAVSGTSLLSRHLKFGTISARTVFHAVRRHKNAETFLSEIAWRDFYYSVLYHFPFVEKTAFKKDLASIQWEGDDAHFDAWCEGRTGYPIVDAAMRQLNTEAWMHNRCRMIVASFLTKDLLINWQQGERYFMQKLVDGDLAANNGGWQWAAGTGTDAQPYFRIFNPVSQGEKFDPRGEYVRKYCPELRRIPDKVIHSPWKLTAAEQAAVGCVLGRDYPVPIVDHATQRARALAMYKRV